MAGETNWRVWEDVARNAIVLQHPTGAEAWFSIYDAAMEPNLIIAARRQYGDTTFTILARLIRAGLRPYRVDGQIEGLVATFALPAPSPMLEDNRADRAPNHHPA